MSEARWILQKHGMGHDRSVILSQTTQGVAAYMVSVTQSRGALHEDKRLTRGHYQSRSQAFDRIDRELSKLARAGWEVRSMHGTAERIAAADFNTENLPRAFRSSHIRYTEPQGLRSTARTVAELRALLEGLPDDLSFDQAGVAFDMQIPPCGDLLAATLRLQAEPRPT